MENFHCFIVDDDREIRNSLIYLLEKSGWRVDAFADGNVALARMVTTEPDVVLSDVRMPGISGLELLQKLQTENAPPIVLISAHGDIPMAVQAMQDGAYSFLEKPFEPRRLLQVLRHAAENYRLKSSTRRLREKLSNLSGLDRVLLGNAKKITDLKTEVFDIADAQGSVLIEGETGSGKELIARALHTLGPRADMNFVAVNCANLVSSGFEEQVFGVVEGLAGLFQKADGGVLFLDEIGACPLESQAKLLRAIETGEIVPVGADLPLHTDVRVLAASSDDLEAKVAEGSFRADLLYRLNTFQIKLPTLRERGDDIIFLFDHFLQQMSLTYEITPPELTAEDAANLLSYDWPGNVRELRHVAERRVLSARRGGGSVAAALRLQGDHDDAPEALRSAIATFERTLIAKSIKAHQGRMDAVAEALGIGRRTLNEKIVKLNLDKAKLLED